MILAETSFGFDPGYVLPSPDEYTVYQQEAQAVRNAQVQMQADQAAAPWYTGKVFLAVAGLVAGFVIAAMLRVD